MKAKDIKAGEIYAHRQGRGEYATVRAVMLLAVPDTDHLYSTTSHHRPKGSPAFVKSRGSAKPSRGKGWSSPDVGYPVVFGPPDAIAALQLEDFEEATSPVYDSEQGIEFGVLTSLTYLAGPYAEVVAEQERQREAAERERQAERERERAIYARVESQRARLAALGVRAVHAGLGGPALHTIGVDDMDKLLSLIDGKEG